MCGKRGFGQLVNVIVGDAESSAVTVLWLIAWSKVLSVLWPTGVLLRSGVVWGENSL